MLRIILIFIMTITMSHCVTGDRRINPGFKHFKIYIEQDNTLKDIDNREVVLDKKPFVIIISFIGPDSIFVNASFSPVSYNASKAGAKTSDIIGFEGTGITEELFNTNEVINLSKNNPNFWHYENENDHRFNKVEKRSGLIFCRRTISNIINLDRRKEKSSITDIRNEELYLVFMKLEWNQNYTSKIEKKRDYLKLIFK